MGADPREAAWTDSRLRDIVALSMLPAMWSGAEPRRIAESLAAALYTTLYPAFVFVSFPAGPSASDAAVMQTGRFDTDPVLAEKHGTAFHEWARSHDPDELLSMPDPGGAGTLRVSIRSLGINAELGVIAVAFLDRHSPTSFQDIVLNVSASQATIAVQNSHLLSKVRQKEEGLRRANQELSEAGRRKDEFLAMLAHELRNPLAAISSAVQLFDKPLEDDRREWVAGMMDRQVGHLTRLIDDLMDVSRITRGKIKLSKEVLDLRPIIDRETATVRDMIEEREQSLAISMDEAPLCLEGDPVRLEQILSNLLTNAVKYSETGGRITLSARQEREEIVVRVGDEGIGIAPDMLSCIFEPFMQADTSLDRGKGGLGIGLTLVRMLAEMHGGSVEAASDGLGQGSVFTLRLPAQKVQMEAPPGPSLRGKASGNGQRVLLVDDNRDAAIVLAHLLEEAGHRVDMVHDGLAALEAVKSKMPDVILLDIGLPLMDGYEVARTLRKEGKLEGLRLIAISGYGQEEDRQQSREAGFDAHLVKPVDHDKLIALLTDAVPNP